MQGKQIIMDQLRQNAEGNRVWYDDMVWDAKQEQNADMDIVVFALQSFSMTIHLPILDSDISICLRRDWISSYFREPKSRADG